MPELYEASITGASDIDNPLTGPRGAAAVFGPQKGASEAEVEILEEALARLAEQVTADLGRDLAGEPGAGAAGGMGFGLLAFFDARLVPGFEIVARAIELDAAIRRADVVLTGEGRLDDSSLGGKSPVGVARIARHHAVPCLAVAGEVAVDPRRLAEEGIERAVGLIDVVGAERATDDTAAALVEAAEGLLKEHLGL